MIIAELTRCHSRRVGINDHRAFTLLELIAVLAIVALLCSATAYCLRTPYQQAQRQHVLDLIVQLDEQLRTATRRFGRPGELTIIFRDGVLESRHAGQGPDAGQKVALPSALSVDQVRTAVRRETYGRVTIPFTNEGSAPTYGLRFKAGNASPEWLLFAGTTGHVVRIQNERDIDAIFKRLAPGRSNAP